MAQQNKNQKLLKMVKKVCAITTVSFLSNYANP